MKRTPFFPGNQAILMIAVTLLITLALTGCSGIFYSPPTAAEYCNIDPALLEPDPAAEAAGKTVLELWATAERQYCWRAYAPLLAATQQPELSLAVRVRNLEINEAPLTEQLMDLAARGMAPDVAFLFHNQAIRLGEAGHLHPLAECGQRPEFQTTPKALWTNFSVDGQAWGIPTDIEVMLLFYNKGMLHQLGWSQLKIDELPAQIASGNYTLQDLIATAREAVRQGVVKPGLALLPNRSQRATIESIYADIGGKFSRRHHNIDTQKKIFQAPLLYSEADMELPQGQNNYEGILKALGDEANSPRNSLVIHPAALEKTYSFLEDLHKHQLLDKKLARPSFGDWGNKLLLRDAGVHNRLLFWHSYISEVPRLLMDYTQNPDDPMFFHKQIGIALLPSAIKHKPGHSQLINSGQYVIFTPSATGRNHQKAACDLLAATQTSGLLQRHTAKSGHPTLSSGGLYLAEWAPAALSLETLLWPPPHMPKMKEYRDILMGIGVDVERGELTASQAVDVAVERLRATFGSQIIIE